jgi:hypothetical protein
MASPDPRQEQVQGRLGALTSDFDRYVDAYDQREEFAPRQLRPHRQTIALRREANGVGEAIDSVDFLVSLRLTLEAWGLGRRQSRLLPQAAFDEAIRSARVQIEALDGLMIDDLSLPADAGERIWQVIESLGVVDNRAKLVAGTKTLHHLLPDLVVPMDREWTGRFFELRQHQWQHLPAQRRTFLQAHRDFRDLACQVEPQQYVDGRGWRTSRTKILDNALIGFCKVELLSEPGDQPADRGRALMIRVPGLPPAKNEALSMLGAGHSHAPRVLNLLRAARMRSSAPDSSRWGKALSHWKLSCAPRRAEIPGTPPTTWAGSLMCWRRSPGEAPWSTSVSCATCGCTRTIARSRRSPTANAKRPTPTTRSGSASSPTQRGRNAQPGD